MPKLRFKDSEGREFPEWEEKILGEYLTVSKSRNTKCAYSKEQVLSVSGELGVVNQISLLGRSYAGASVVPYRIVETGDIVYTKSPLKTNPYGIIKTNRGESGIVSTLYAVYHPKNCTDSRLIEYYFESDFRLNKYLKPLVNIGAKHDMKISNETVLQGIVCLPSLPEQQKITDFLTAYDTMIDTQTKRVETMKTRKKGLLQKIFSQEIRFRDDEGKEFPEWEEKKLGEVTLIERGASPRPIEKYITSNDEGINWIKIGDAPIDGNVISNVKEKITDEGASKSRAVKKGDLILSNSMSYGRPYLLNVDGCIHDGWLLIRNSQNKFDSAFLLQLLSSSFVKLQYERLSNQGVVSNLNKELVKSVDVYIPALPEQQKIADFLTAVDHQIEVEEKRLETMKIIKKGLLQQMFI